MSRIVILMYHMIDEPRTNRERRFACPPNRFRQHMRMLRSGGFELVGLESIRQHLSGERVLPSGAVAVTLDDGFCDNYEKAFPILIEHGIPATVFMVTGALGKDNAWMSDSHFRRRRMLSCSQAREMAEAGIVFGSHTVSHPRLSRLGKEEAAFELRESKKQLEAGLETAVTHFAYPYGDFSPETVQLVKEAGYRTACTTRSGFNRRKSSPYLLRRLEVHGTDSAWQLSQKLKFGVSDSSLTFPLKYYWSRARARLM